MTDEKISFHNEKRKLGDLLPHEHNPRRLSPQQAIDLRRSLKKFSLAEIPVINTDNKILAGHQRIKILGDLEGADYEIDVRVPNRTLTQEEADEYLIRSNKNTGEWDAEILTRYFDEDFLMDVGFTADELVELAGIDEEDIDYSIIVNDNLAGIRKATDFEPLTAEELKHIETFMRHNDEIDRLVNFVKEHENEISPLIKKLLERRIAQFVIFNFDKIACYHLKHASEIEQQALKMAYLVFITSKEMFDSGIAKLNAITGAISYEDDADDEENTNE